MTLPRTVAEVLSDHALFRIECMDRAYLNVYQPRLQHAAGIAAFFAGHRGSRLASSALMGPVTGAFVADLGHFIAARGLDLYRFGKGGRKDDITQRRLRQAPVDERGLVPEQVLYIGAAREKVRVFRTERRRDPVTGATCPWLVRGSGVVSQYYCCCADEDFGPICLKFSSYFPYTARAIINGHEYARRQCARAGRAFTALDNGFAEVAGVAAVQAICDQVTAEKIGALAARWLRILPHPFTADDIAAGCTCATSVLQIELATTVMPDTPAAGRILFDQIIGGNLDPGRPDMVPLIFDRAIRRRARRPAPGRFRTRVITRGVTPGLHTDCKNSKIRQYHKPGKAIRTETTIDDTRDFGVAKGRSHLPELRQIGFQASQRLLDVQRISHDPADGAAALTARSNPVISDTGTRTAAMPITAARVQALLAALCVSRLLPSGFTNRDLRNCLAPLPGRHPEDMTSGQITCDLRRLRARGFIQRIPGTHRCTLTGTGIRRAVFLTRMHRRFLIPAMAAINDLSPPRTRLQAAAASYDRALDDLARCAGIAA